MHCSVFLLRHNNSVRFPSLQAKFSANVIAHSFQPETLHSVVDSSRSRLFLVYRPVVPVIGRKDTTVKGTASSRPKVPKNPFRIFLNPDIDVLLAVTALICAVFYGVLASISSLFVAAYPFLNETTIGLCFLGIGGGMAIGSSVNGRILDAQYQRYKRKAMAERRETESPVDLSREESFPLEKVVDPYLFNFIF